MVTEAMVSYATHKLVQEVRQLARLRETDKLIKLLNHKEEAVRFEAAWSLGRLGEMRAYPHLVKLLRDPVPAVVRWAISALAALGQAEAVVPMVETISHNHSTWLESRVEHAVWELGHEACLPYLLKLLERKETRYRAANQVAALGVKAVDPLLERLDEASTGTRNAILRALGKIGDITALASLEELKASQAADQQAPTAAAIQAIKAAYDRWYEERRRRAGELEAAGRKDEAALIYEDLGLAAEAQRLRATLNLVGGDDPAGQVAADFFGGSGSCE